MSKQNVSYLAKTLLDLLKLLYPKSDYNKDSEKFFSKDNLLPVLSFVDKKRLDILNNSTEEEKYEMYSLIIVRLKELYCTIGEYQKAIEVVKEPVSKRLNTIIDDVSLLDEVDIFLVANEFIARFEANKSVDEQIYNALKVIPADSFEFLMPSHFSFDNEYYFLYYDEEKLIKALISFVEKLSLEGYRDILSRYIIQTSCLLSELSKQYIAEDMPKEKNIEHVDEVLTNFVRLREVASSVSELLLQIVDIYFNLAILDIANKEIEYIAFPEPLSKDEFEGRIIKFCDDLNLNFLEKFKEQVVEALRIYGCEAIYGSIENEELLKLLFKILDKKGTPKYKAEFLKEFLFNKRLIYHLFKFQKYEGIAEIYFRNLDDEKLLDRWYFEFAYSLSKSNYKEEAKRIYENAIEVGKEVSAVYNNLGVIYEYDDKDYVKALEYYNKAILLDEANEIASNNVKKLEKKIKEEAEKPKKIKDAYFKKTKPWQKKILFAIYKLSDAGEELTFEMLSEATKQDIRNLKKEFSYLEDLGLVEYNNGRILLEANVERLVEKYINPTLERQILKVDNSKFYRPIFYDESEILLYKALIELFPQHLVFPNISLKTIFDVDKLKEVLEEDIIKYLFMAHVDFAIINTSNYLPVLAFEKDSDFNDTDYAKELAAKKDSIFRTGGLPLIRLRFNSGMDLEKLKYEVKEATKTLILELNNNQTSYEVDLTKEFDIKKFGIVNSPVSIESIQKVWEETIGRGIAQKSKIFDVEDEYLVVEISQDLASIIDMSKDSIKDKMSSKFEFIKEIQIIWY